MSEILSRRRQIEEHLWRIEKKHEVNILFACEAGSRAWNFESVDSDYDVRFIYARPLRYYLSIDEGRPDTIHRTTGNYDIEGWDILKALRLLYRGNPRLQEWVRSPIIYFANVDFRDRLVRAIAEYYTPSMVCLGHYGVAENNYRRYICGKDFAPLKRYLYVFRNILAYEHMERDGEWPPIDFHVLYSTWRRRSDVFRGGLYSEVDRLIEKKQSSREKDVGRYSALLSYFVEFFARTAKPERETSGLTTSHLSEIFRRSIR